MRIAVQFVMADPWAVSESGESDSSGASSALAAALQHLAPKKRGRPRKYARGTGRTERRRLLEAEREGALIGEPPEPIAALAAPAPASASVGSILASHVRSLGDPMSILVANQVRTSCSTVSGGTRKVVHYYLPDGASNSLVPVRLMGTTAMSQVLGMPRRTAQRKLFASAAAVYYGSRALASSVISKTLQRQTAGMVKVVACFKHVLCDETPFHRACARRSILLACADLPRQYATLAVRLGVVRLVWTRLLGGR